MVESLQSKKSPDGSVENLDDHKNHDVVSEDEQAEVAALAVVGAAVDMGALATFDHRDHRFDLRSAAIGSAIEPHLHETAVTAPRRLVGGSTVLGGNDGPHAVLVARKAVVGLRVIPGIGRHLRQPYDPQCFGHQRTELVDIGPRTATGLRGENEMIVRATHQAQFGITMINHGFPRVSLAVAAVDEVAARTTAFEARRIDRRALHPSLAAQVQANGGLQQSSRRPRWQQAARGFLKSGEVGNLLQFQSGKQRRIVLEMGRQAAIVGPQKVLQHQAGEQLMLRELLGTVAVSILRQRPPRRSQRRQNHRLGRFTRPCHNCCTQQRCTVV